MKLFLRKGKETTPNYVYDQATDTWKQAPGPGKVSVLRPYETPQEKETRQINVAAAKETMRSERPAKGKDYTAKLADLDIKEIDRADKITQKYNKQIAELPRGKTFPVERDRLLKERDAALKENKTAYDTARKKLGGRVPTKPLKDMSTEELRAAIARMKGQPAPATAAPTGGGGEEEDDEEE